MDAEQRLAAAAEALVNALDALESAVAIDPTTACSWLAAALEKIADGLTGGATLRVHHHGPLFFVGMPLEGRAWRAWSVTEMEDIGRICEWAAHDDDRRELFRAMYERTVPVDEVTGA